MPFTKSMNFLSVFLVVFGLCVLALVLVVRSVTSVPSYLTTAFRQAIDERHIWTINRESNHYSITDTQTNTTFLVSGTSTKEIEAFVSKPVLISGRLRSTNSLNSKKIYGSGESNVSAVVVEIDTVVEAK